MDVISKRRLMESVIRFADTLQFEKRYELRDVTPLDALKLFMEDRSERPRDLIPIIGASSIASAVLNGKRDISKRQARLLAKRYGVSVGMFI